MLFLPQTVSRCGLIALLGLLLTAAPLRGADSEAVVQVAKLNVRSAPTRDGRRVGALTMGARVKVLDRADGWLKVAFDGGVGYLRDRERYVRVIGRAAAPASSVEPIDTVQRRAEELNRQIERGRAEVVEITAQERAVIGELDDIDRRLNDTGRQLAGLKDEMQGLEKRIAKTRQAVADLSRERRQMAAQAARRLVALYKLHWLGRVQVLVAAPTMHDFLSREAALRHILDADEVILGNLARQRRALEALAETQAAQQLQQQSLTDQVNTRLRAVASEKARRQELLEEIRGRKTLQLASIEALKKAAGQLDDAIQNLNRTAETRQPAEAAGAAFESRKGLLNIPVSGSITNFFGPYRNPRFNAMNFRSGIDIRADKGEPIRAVHGGRVLYASWFKGYGNMMIIDHGDAYYTVYAHAEELFKKMGATVEAGEVIATVGDTGSLDGAMLYFEIRHHGKPEDPLGWLQAG